MPGVMSGYALHIRQLNNEDVALWKIDMTGVPIEECVALVGEDLGEALAAVVHLKKDADNPLVWTAGSNWGVKPLPNEFVFADAVATVLVSLFPHLTEIK